MKRLLTDLRSDVEVISETGGISFLIGLLFAGLVPAHWFMSTSFSFSVGLQLNIFIYSLDFLELLSYAEVLADPSFLYTLHKRPDFQQIFILKCFWGFMTVFQVLFESF